MTYTYRPIIMLAALTLIALASAKAGAATIGISVTNSTVVGDGSVATANLIVNITGISGPPAADIGWTLELNSAIFNITGVTASVSYVDDTGNVYIATPTVDHLPKGVDISFKLGSTTSSSLLINITAYIPVLPGIVNEAGIPVAYIITARSSDAYETVNSNMTIYIVPEPPSISVSVAPLLVSPGVPVTVNVSAVDGSGVENVSLMVLFNGSKPVFQQVWGSSETGNPTVFEASVKVLNTSLKGDYTVVVEACDILGNCANATASFNVTDVFTVPGDFASLSEALASPVVTDGVTLAVTGIVEEAATVVVSKSVSIVGVIPGAKVVFGEGTAYGFNLTSGGASVENLVVEGAETGFLLCSSGNTISGVEVTGARFLEVCSLDYLDNVVEDSLLNGTPVLYVYANTTSLSGSYAEAYLYAGSYTLEGFMADYLEAAQSSIVAHASSLSVIRDLGGSNITLYDSNFSSYAGTGTSRLEAYRSLDVTVLYAGGPFEGAGVRVEGALLEEPLLAATGADGVAAFTVLVARGSTVIEAYNTTVAVTAEYMGLQASATVDLEETSSLQLELPVPSLAAELTDLLGNTVNEIKPGQLLRVNVTYALQGFTGSANLTAILLKNGEEIVSTTIPLGTDTSSLELLVFVPWEKGNYSIIVRLDLESLTPIEKQLP